MKRIALLGMPNTGKSTFFNRLTGSVARVGNWPGITVELLDARILLGAEMVEVVDLPGIYNLHGYSEDEQVVRHFLEHNPVNLLCVVANAAQLDRQLSLVLQLKELGLPMVLLLNMMDEAKRLGVDVEQEKLEKALGVPVIPLSAKHGQGFPWAKGMLEKSLQGTQAQTADPDNFAHDDKLEQELEKLVNETVHTPIQLTPTLTCRIDRTLLHPWLGLPLFLLSMYLLFEAVYTVGTPLQDGVEWLLGLAKQSLIEPALVGTSPVIQSFLLEGVYNGVGTVLSFLPIIVLFFLFMGVVEDSGYLSRAAFLMDAFMARLGLDGRSFVMQLMGFGCNVPALMGTRVMRSRGLRLLTMLIIPFSLCSARLQVFVFLTTAVFSPRSAPFVLFSLYVMSFFAAFLTALLYRRKLPNSEPLLLELPPYRLPTVRQMINRGWHEATHFVRDAGGFILLGVVAVWFLTHYPFNAEPAGTDTLAGQIAGWMAPVFAPLGIDNLMSIALLFGFVAKEVVVGALAVIYGTSEGALSGIIATQLTWIEAYSFMLFVLIYTPCLSTIAVMKQESKSWLFTTLAVVWPLTLAWLASFIFYQVATRLTA